jgi:hypothetical protein
MDYNVGHLCFHCIQRPMRLSMRDAHPPNCPILQCGWYLYYIVLHACAVKYFFLNESAFSVCWPVPLKEMATRNSMNSILMLVIQGLKAFNKYVFSTYEKYKFNMGPDIIFAYNTTGNNFLHMKFTDMLQYNKLNIH